MSTIEAIILGAIFGFVFGYLVGGLKATYEFMKYEPTGPKKRQK